MHVLEARNAIISNYEVYQLIQEEQQRQSTQQKANPSLKFTENLMTVQYETIKYLKTTPSETQSPEQIAGFMEKFKQYNLTKYEKLQILNHRPKSLVELYILIEECFGRYSDDDLNQMLEDIYQTLPREDDEVAEEVGTEGEVAEEEGGDQGDEMAVEEEEGDNTTTEETKDSEE
ncbi:hypothetical protein H4219_006281 [Mycoemilia scoparia]|uniref:DNA-directed RNA polymerase III subunit RPC9 n=1 Tax=Mycoemilia scoparia TaxID=417184 RepID=A0A9W8DME6_9FUNG|nr:hypothetical protein H4219_006281 [Mycoemilia scoparia]